MGKLIDKCPLCFNDCELDVDIDWAMSGIVPNYCSSCDSVFWSRVINESHLVGRRQVNCDLPDISIGSFVRVIIREGTLYGLIGRVVGRRYAHYLVDIGYRKVLISFNGVEIYNG